MAIATILQAKKEKRKSHGIIFGASEKEIFEIDVNRLEDLATASFHMGTNFGPPLRWAQDKFKETRERISSSSPTAFVTLEEERKAEFIQAKSSSGARCFSVLIGSDATDTVKQFSDKVFSLRHPNVSDGGQILSEI